MPDLPPPALRRPRRRTRPTSRTPRRPTSGLLSLPLFPDLTEAEQDRVVDDARRPAVTGHRRGPGPDRLDPPPGQGAGRPRRPADAGLPARPPGRPRGSTTWWWPPATCPRTTPSPTWPGAGGVAVVRGSEADVLAPLRDRALDAFPADVVVRVTGDCPLSDPAVIEAAIGLHARRPAPTTCPTACCGPSPWASTSRSSPPPPSARPAPRPPTAPSGSTSRPSSTAGPSGSAWPPCAPPSGSASRRWTVDTAGRPRPGPRHRRRPRRPRRGRRGTTCWPSTPHPPGGGEGSPELVPAAPADDEVDRRDDRRRRDGAAGHRVTRSCPPVTTCTAPPAPGSSSQDGGVVGWVQLAVEDGVGRLGGRACRGRAPVVLDALRRYLQTDFQVRRWDPDPWITAGPAAPAS